MLRRLFLLLAVFLLLCVPRVYADFGDESTLGGQNSDGEYRWRVTGDGNLIPGDDSATDIGESGKEVQVLYVDTITLTTGSVVNSDPDADSMAAGDTTVSYDYGVFEKTAAGDESLVLGDGTVGQMITIIFGQTGSGRVTISADTQTGWSTAYLNKSGECITFYYANDTIGWVVIGTAGHDLETVDSLIGNAGKN